MQSLVRVATDISHIFRVVLSEMQCSFRLPQGFEILVFVGPPG